jgi:hypothetical protein
VQLQVLVPARNSHELAIEGGAVPDRRMPAVRAVVLSKSDAPKTTIVSSPAFGCSDVGT